MGADGQAGTRGCVVFFRDDDVDALTDELVALMSFFLAEEIPVNYQVVPAKLEDDACEFVLDKRRAHPQLIRLNQHGHTHEHVINGVHTWFEYSGNRPYEDQYESIQRGRRILSDKLGMYFDGRVFTPPGHKYDENTLHALEALGFQILSASSYTSPQARLYYGLGKVLRRSSLLGRRVSYHGQLLPGHRLLELSVALDVDMAKDRRGDVILKTSAQLVHEFEQARQVSDLVGIVLHHSRYTGEKRDALREFVAFLRSTPGVSFQLIEDVAEGLAHSAQL